MFLLNSQNIHALAKEYWLYFSSLINTTKKKEVQSLIQISSLQKNLGLTFFH